MKSSSFTIVLLVTLTAGCGSSGPNQKAEKPEPDTSEELGEAANAVGDDVEEAAEEVADDVERGAEDIEEEFDGEKDDD
ncbi:MAG: hypothetical protein AAGA56_22790 [Myxococcota bacterium]